MNHMVNITDAVPGSQEISVAELKATDRVFTADGVDHAISNVRHCKDGSVSFKREGYPRRESFTGTITVLRKR
jgi:hypothetical protein